MMLHRAPVLAHLLAHGAPPFHPAAIVFARGFQSPPVMTPNRVLQPSKNSTGSQKHDNDKPVISSVHALKAQLSSATRTYGSSEVALLHIMKTHDFRPSLLQQVLDGRKFSFSKLKYKDIAPLVGLEPSFYMRDMETFNLHRSRIPTALFQSILQDIDVLMMRFGSHVTDARSLSPIFNHLIATFGFAFKDIESPFKGHITIKEKMKHHFKILDATPVFFIKANCNFDGGEEHLNVIAQVIAECSACDWVNTHNGFQAFHIPVYGIICDEDTFEFFLFDGTTNPPSFKHGLCLDEFLIPGLNHHFQLPNPLGITLSNPTQPFIHALRLICETIFDLLLSGYVSSLKAYHNYSMDKQNNLKNTSTMEGLPKKAVDDWKNATNAAIHAWQGFRDAEMKRQTQLTKEANSIVEGAMTSLKYSVKAIPNLYKPELFMSSWNKELKGIEKV